MGEICEAYIQCLLLLPMLCLCTGYLWLFGYYTQDTVVTVKEAIISSCIMLLPKIGSFKPNIKQLNEADEVTVLGVE